MHQADSLRASCLWSVQPIPLHPLAARTGNKHPEAPSQTLPPACYMPMPGKSPGISMAHVKLAKSQIKPTLGDTPKPQAAGIVCSVFRAPLSPVRLALLQCAPSFGRRTLPKQPLSRSLRRSSPSPLRSHHAQTRTHCCRAVRSTAPPWLT